jgi:hypothetical protein
VHDDGLGADIQHVSYFLVGMAFGDQLQHLFFPVRKILI